MASETISDVYNLDDLDEITSILSNDSYLNIQAEIKKQKASKPQASGIGVDHLAYIPRTLSECVQKVKNLLKQLAYFRQYCFLLEISERGAKQELKKALRENQKLTVQVGTLEDDLLRVRNQLHSAFGLKKKSGGIGKKELNEAPPKRKTKRRGAPIGHIGRTRPIPTQITRKVVIPPPDRCPYCNSQKIKTESEYISKYTEDIPEVVKEVIETRYLKGQCLCCHQKVVAEKATSGPPVNIGPNLISLLTVLRQQGGVSYRKLSRLCTECFKISLKPSGVLGIISRVSRRLEPFYKGIEASLFTQPVIHGDETGWKMDGQRWYLWSLCNKNLTYFHLNASRAAKVVSAILPKNYPGIFHSDFYGAYNIYANTQRCLVHLMRDVNNELDIKPKSTVLKKLKQQIKQIIKKGQQIQKQQKSLKKEQQKSKLKARLLKLCQLKSSDKKTKNLITRIDRYQDHLLQFVNHEDAEFHNNRAERALRPAVIFRKISFGNRTEQGAENFAILNSVLETGRLKNKNINQFIHSVISAPSIRPNTIKKFLLDSS